MSLIPTTITPETPTVSSGAQTPTTAPTMMPTQNDPTLNLVAAANAGPQLSPSATVGIAQTANGPMDASVNAYWANNLAKAAQVADQLKTLSPAQQAKIWSVASEASKTVLVAANYRPPEFTPPAQGGWFHDALSVLDASKHAVYAAGDAVIQHLPTTIAWKAAGNLINHAVGAAVTDLQQGELASGNPNSLSSWLNVLNIHHFVTAWGETGNTSMSYQPEAIRYVKQEMGVTGQALQLAKMAASGATLTQIISSVPGAQRGQAYALIKSTPKFIDAVNLLSDSHVGFGQTVFGGINANQAHQIFPKANLLGMQAVNTLAQAGTTAATAFMATTGDTAPAAGELSAAAPTVDAATGLLSDTQGTIGGLQRAGSALANVKRTALMAGAGMQTYAGMRGAVTGQTPDQAFTISPFGTPVHVASGIADALVSWYANPVQMGFAGKAAYRAGEASAFSRAFKDAQETEAVYRNATVYNRWANKFASVITTPWREGAATTDLNAEASGLAEKPNMGLVMTNMGLDTTHMAPLIREHYADIKAAVATGDKAEIGAAVGRMMGDAQGMVNVASGRMSKVFHEAIPFPKMTWADSVIDRLRGSASAAMNGERFNMAKLSPLDALRRIVGDKQTELIAAADAQQPELGIAARMMRRGTSLVSPGAIDTSTADGTTSLDRALSYALTPARKSDILSYYMNADTEGQRILVARAGVLEMLRTAWGWSEEAQKQLALEEDRMHFGAPGSTALYVNPLNPEGPRMEMAVLDSQLSSQIGVPRYSDIFHYSKKSWLMKGVEGTFNNHAFDWFMAKLWKPFMLLRLGFGIRFGGEEAALFALRHGGTAYLRSRAAASLTDAFSVAARDRAMRDELVAKSAAGDVAAWQKLQAIRGISSVTSHIPDGVLDGSESPQQLMGKIYGWHAVQWFQGVMDRVSQSSGMEAARAVAAGVAGPDLLETAQLAGEQGYLDGPFAESISAAGRHQDSYLGEFSNIHDAQLFKSENGLPMQLVRNGTFEIKHSDDPAFLAEYHRSLQMLSDSRWARVAMRAHAQGGYNAQIQSVEDALRGRGLWQTVALARKAVEDYTGTDEEFKQVLADKVTKAEEAVAAHEELLRRFPVSTQTENGLLTRGQGPETDQMFRDWSRAIVDTVNHKLMTLKVQDLEHQAMLDAMAPDVRALHVSGEMELPAEHANPHPILMRPGRAPMLPYEVASSADPKIVFPMSETFPDSAYTNLADGHVRLFTPVAEGDRVGYNPALNPGRFWTPNFQRASDLATEDGKVYHVDVPASELASSFIAHNAEDGVDHAAQIERAQHPLLGDTIAPNERIHFESGDIHYGQTSHNTPMSLMDWIGRGMGVPDVKLLRKLDPEVLPSEIYTPTMVMKAPAGGFDRFMSRAFYHLAGRPADYLSRQPAFLWELHIARVENDKMYEGMGVPDPGHQMAMQVGYERALRETSRYIHNPDARSQFSVIGRNIAPFWFAQEQFYKRWGHLFGAYPEAFYKLAMTMNGLRSVGFIQNDSYGQPAFMVPGTPQFVHALETLPPFKQFFPAQVNAGFSMEVASLNPSLSNNLMPIPSFGPFVTTPVLVAGWAFPPLSPFSQFFQGPNAAPVNTQQGRAWRLLGQWLPSLLTRGAAYADTEQMGSTSSTSGPALYLATRVAAAQQLIAAGYGPTKADMLNPIKMQQWANLVDNWTKNMMLLRTIFGFVAPGIPNFGFNDKGVGQQLLDLLASTNSKFTAEDAISAFIKANPGATADTIFATTTSGRSQSGAYIPATQEAAQWLDKNAAFVNAFPQAAMFAMPTDAATGAFNEVAYQKEISMGLRAHRSLFNPNDPTSWLVQYEYSKAANVYYNLEQYVYAAGGAPTHADASNAQAQLNMTQEQAAQVIGFANASTEQIKQAWDQWKQGFTASNPIFAQEQTSMGANSSARRSAVVEQLQQAIKTGNLPEGEWSTHVAELMDAFNQVQQFYATTQGNSSFETQRSQMKQAMMIFGTQFAIMHPDVSTLWTSVLSKQIGVVG